MPDKALKPASSLNVVLCWHMHQPEYRDPVSGICDQPWTYLRAVKDYTDMAAHLEQVPGSRAVVNFSPLLLLQLDRYSEQLNHYFTDSRPPLDPLLRALVEPSIDKDQERRYKLIKRCLDHHNFNSGQHFETYVALNNIGRHILDNPSHITYVCDDFFTDLLVWFHLSWLGETVRRDDPRVQKLIARERRYSMYDRIQLMRVISDQVSQVIPRYRALAERQIIELSMTPYGHPIGPLLVDLNSAKEATPHLVMPNAEEYPGGIERLNWHIEAGKELFVKYFSAAPIGCWPGEGALSDASLTVLDNSGFAWTASGAGVLRNSLKNSGQQSNDSDTKLFSAFTVGDRAIRCFFRDDHLSDLIGFTYSEWHADDAVANFISRLEEIAERCAEQPDAVVTIIMDGENAWEHYHQNGFYFLRGLYRQLADHPNLDLTTFSECLQGHSKQLDHITAGSWVYGNLTTWIGSADKNRAWDMLINAKNSFDQVLQSQRLSADEQLAAERQMAVCEGSDWFWWPGGDNPPETVSAFDESFRMHLKALYSLLGLAAPDYLQHPFTHSYPGDGFCHEVDQGGVMRRAE